MQQNCRSSKFYFLLEVSCINWITTLQWILLSHFSPCSGLVVSGYSKGPTDESWMNYFSQSIEPYKKFRKMYTVDKTGAFKGNQYTTEPFKTKHKLFDFFKTLILNCIWDLWGFIFMQQHLTESLWTGQLSLWTSCQLLEEPWDSSLGSPSSVESRFSTFLSRSSFKS